VNLIAVNPLVLCLVTATGYAAQPMESGRLAGEEEFIPCQESRPQLCTMQYDPVCGVLRTGETKTYSNACSACRDHAVSGYTDGTCGLYGSMQRP
jgi:hypothetical protein